MHSSFHFPVSSTSQGSGRLYACVCAATLPKMSVKLLIRAAGDSECFHVTCRVSSHWKNDSAAYGFEQTLSRIPRKMDPVCIKSPDVEFAVDPKLSSQRILLQIDWVIQSSCHLLQLLPLEGKFISLSTRRKSGTHTCAAYVCHIPWRMVTICWGMSFQARGRHKWSRRCVFVFGVFAHVCSADTIKRRLWIFSNGLCWDDGAAGTPWCLGAIQQPLWDVQSTIPRSKPSTSFNWCGIELEQLDRKRNCEMMPKVSGTHWGTTWGE